MPNPFTEALAKLASRTAVESNLDSAEWAAVPSGLRERAFFSARVTNAGYVQEIKDRVESILQPKTVMRGTQPVTEGINPATARAELKQLLESIGYDPGDKRGSIQDLSSDARLNLQIKTNVESAQGYGDFLQGQAPGALDAFPAQELFRAEDREEPRDWIQRWRGAGGRLHDGARMIALKSDPIWTELSAFGTPYPPFDFNSGMWVRDVSRDEAERLGLIAPGAEVQSTVPAFNENLEASVRNLAPDIQASLKESFGDQIEIVDGVAQWVKDHTTMPSKNPERQPEPPILPHVGSWESESKSTAPKIEVTLYRATTDVTDLKTVPPGTSWTPEKETAKAYTDNPGFGGPNLVELRVTVPKDRVLDLRGGSARDLDKLAKAVGGDAQQWRDDGLTTVWQVIEERQKVAKALREKGDWVILKDDYPENATTWRKT